MERRIKLYQPIGINMNFIATIKNQRCYPCNKSLCFIILKQFLNYKVHNLGKQPLSYYFGRFLYAGIYCTGFPKKVFPFTKSSTFDHESYDKMPFLISLVNDPNIFKDDKYLFQTPGRKRSLIKKLMIRIETMIIIKKEKVP